LVFHIDEGAGIPVYLQIKQQILQAMSRGQLSPGDQLPTVRQVAVDLAINPNTVNHAYAALERDGIVASRRGRGTFIAEKARPATAGERKSRLADIARRAIGEARAFGFSARELADAAARAARDDR
jgi:GntR family transcriptional regulator